MPRAIEKDDCFTCAANSRLCDRQLHRCRTCTDSSEVCRYPVSLRWRIEPSSRRKRPILARSRPRRVQSSSVKRSDTSEVPQTPISLSAINTPTEIYSSSFDPIVPEEDTDSAVQDFPLWSALSEADEGQLMAAGSSINDVSLNIAGETSNPLLPPSTVLDVSDCLITTTTTTNASANSLGEKSSGPSSLPAAAAATHGWSPNAQFYQDANLTKPFEISSLLDLYRNQLCKIPVTHDFPANPFRCDTTPSLLSIHQTHAIVAITLQYLSRAPSPVSNQVWLRHVAKRERELACKGRKQSGGGEVFCSSEFLDTLLVLVTLEHMCRGAGPWQGLILDVMSIVEGAGGISQMTRSPRRQAQLAMFVWWDITISLLSRQRGFLSQQYYDFVLGCECEEWNFEDLTGIPKSLVSALVEIVQLTQAQNRIVGMKWALFDDWRVREIERDLSDSASFLMPDLRIDEEIDTDETIQDKHDRTACIQAWKFAVRLYIARVFPSSSSGGGQQQHHQHQHHSAKILSLARQTLDAARSCRSTSVMSKQLLFPIFLAGSETNDAYSRRYVEAYCKCWYAKTRYQLFPDTLQLLTTIWNLRDLGNGDDHQTWWGSVLADLEDTTLYHGRLVRIHYLLG